MSDQCELVRKEHAPICGNVHREYGCTGQPPCSKPFCRECLRSYPCVYARLSETLAHYRSVVQEIVTIAEHDEPSGVDDGRNDPLSAEARLQEIVDLVEREVLL